MRCLSSIDCEQTIYSLGITLGTVRGEVNALDGRRVPATLLGIPDSCRRQALGILGAFSFFEPDDEQPEQPKSFLLWLTGWGAWPNEEFPELWDEIRARHGETRARFEAPGHLFQPEETRLACGMTRLAMLFGWDAFLISAPFSFAMYMTNDNELFLYSRNSLFLEKLTASLAMFFQRRGSAAPSGT